MVLCLRKKNKDTIGLEEQFVDVIGWEAIVEENN